MGRAVEGQHGGSVCAGVAGHLFAIAANKSVEYNYNGAITGNAAKIMEVYDYEWTDDEL